MSASLAAAAALMGLVALPHCAGMCGGACAAAARLADPEQPRRALAGLLLGRLMGYAVAGAAVAAVVGALQSLGSAVAGLRPLWHLLQALVAVLGLWLLLRGHLPTALQAWLEPRPAQGLNRRPVNPPDLTSTVMPAVTATARLATAGPAWVPLRFMRRPGATPAYPRRIASTAPWLRSLGLGSAWALWPCGVLQAALLLASLASGPAQGALVMAVFALASSAGPALLPLLAPLLVRRGGRPLPGAGGTLPLRLAGASLLAASGLALWHGVVQPAYQLWCA